MLAPEKCPVQVFGCAVSRSRTCWLGGNSSSSPQRHARIDYLTQEYVLKSNDPKCDLLGVIGQVIKTSTPEKKVFEEHFLLGTSIYYALLFRSEQYLYQACQLFGVER